MTAPVCEDCRTGQHRHHDRHTDTGADAGCALVADRTTLEPCECATVVHQPRPGARPWQTMPLRTLQAAFADGDGQGWNRELDWLDEHHADRLADLEASIRAHGIRTPVLLGDDARVWDGHHRIAVARRLGLTRIPVTYSEDQ